MYAFARLLFDPSQGGLLLFMLVLTRVSALFLAAPIFGPRETPVRVRAFLAIGLTVLAFPLQPVDSVRTPGSLVDLALMMTGEAVVGLTLGVGVMMLFVGLQVTGQIMGQMSGMQLADMFDANFGEQTAVFAKLLDLVAMAVFFAIGGHRQVIIALLDGFVWMPPGQAAFSPSMLELVTSGLAQSFVLGLKAAAPIMASLFASMVVLGLLGRALPQLNIFALGFSLNASVMLVTLWVSIGAIGWLFHEEAMNALENFRQMMQD
ncbi:flagellar biosynthetic protein FliR [Lignipirellula cremea]|uniref:Flagellar biosynthetic protein FliR n=1 Tax=Lignipirellula cremea TaxID=2528010 RepID=A0A518E0I1_9BACT|nr:flagellar biosynthetic protein FliR [Lignipirellula cremea]QDU97600.1 Flagellar biosynthetic protein FliR [Lignipirellula cremea]